MLPKSVEVALSGERYQVVYSIVGDGDSVPVIARQIAVEQTVEFPEDLLPLGDIPESIVGQVESITEISPRKWQAVISYAIESAGFELTQLLNNVFGNMSLHPGIRLEKLSLSPKLLSCFRGPRYGQSGLRTLLGVHDRPLLSTALKPMGLSPSQLGSLAYEFAMGGIDMIKDDHGLANQPFSAWVERVQYATEAIAKANAKTGGHSIYMPNLTAPLDRILEFARIGKEAGVGGFLISPGLTGFDALRLLAEQDEIGLPIMSHPAFLGSFVTHPNNGISHYALFGQLMRLAGADATVYPNYGGRFSFSQEECKSIVSGSTDSMGHMAAIFPAPGGGMSLEHIPELFHVYGKNVIFLIGGGLFRGTGNIVENSKRLLDAVQKVEFSRNGG